LTPFGAPGRAALRVEDYLVLSAVLVLPWAFGGVRMWAYRSAALLLAGGAAAAFAARGRAGLGFDRGARWLVPAFLLAGLALLQIVPLPPVAVRFLSPRADAIYRESFPGYPGKAPGNLLAAIETDALSRVPEASKVSSPDGKGMGLAPTPRGRWSGWRTLSLEPGATSERFFWYVALLLAFLVVRQGAADREIMHRYRGALFLLFALLALFALVQRATWNGHLYWIGPKVENSSVLGPYVNFDHFAAVMEVAAPWLAAYAWSRTRGRGGEVLRDPRGLFPWGAAVLCLVAGLGAGSKMATVLLVVSLSAVAVMGVHGVRRRVAVGAGLVLLWSSAAALALGTSLSARFVSFFEASRGGLAENLRWVAWRAAGPMVLDFPLTGIGFGAFAQLFPRYLPTGETGQWGYLHNDYMQLVVEGGLVAGALTAWLAWGFATRAVRHVLASTRPASSLARFGLLLGIGSLAVHAIVDFNHQIPANALLFVVLSALAVPAPEARPGDPA
jgi:hypothetical protein